MAGEAKAIQSHAGMGLPVRQPFGYGAPQNPFTNNAQPAPDQPAGGGGFTYGGGVGAPGGAMEGPPPSEMKPSSMDSDSMQSLMQAMNPQRETPMLGSDMGEDISSVLGKGTPRNRTGALAALAGVIY